MRFFVDANVFLRHFTQDQQKQAAQAEALFEGARRGDWELLCGPPVLFEVAWTLRRGFGLKRETVQDMLESVLAMEGLTVQDGSVIRRALGLGRDHKMEFADAYIAASALAEKAGLATFNQKDFKDSGVKLRAWAH